MTGGDGGFVPEIVRHDEGGGEEAPHPHLHHRLVQRQPEVPDNQLKSIPLSEQLHLGFQRNFVFSYIFAERVLFCRRNIVRKKFKNHYSINNNSRTFLIVISSKCREFFKISRRFLKILNSI